MLKMLKSAGQRLLRSHPDQEPRREIPTDEEWPQVLHMEATSACNLRCVMCPTTLYPENKLIEPLVFERILEAAPHCKGVVPSMGGEALAVKNFPRMLEQLRERMPEGYISFNTNATLLTKELCEHFVKMRVNEIIISMDGAKAETYNRIRVRGDFDSVVANARMLVKAKGDNPLPRLGMLLVAFRSNVAEIPDLVRLVADLRLQKLMINGLEPYTPEQGQSVCYGREVDPQIEQYYAEAEALAAEHGIEFIHADLQVTGRKLYCPSFTVMMIRADGEVYPCAPYMYDAPFYYHGEERRHQGPLSFGNVKDTSVYEIWNSEKYRAFRQALRERKLHAECRQCLLAEGHTCNVQIWNL